MEVVHISEMSLTSTRLYGITSQKTAVFIVTAIRISHLIRRDRIKNEIFRDKVGIQNLLK
jgi:hypothetical protein